METQCLDFLLQAGTAAVSDVFDTMKQVPPVLANSLAPVLGEGVGFAGPAYTIAGEMSAWDGSGDRSKLLAIDEMVPGVVAVWAGTDIHGVCCFGDLLAGAMKARGCVGAVVDGGVRDVNILKSLGLPMLARYVSPAQAIGRWRVTSHQESVTVRGAVEEWVTVNPGDIIVCDADGAVVVPSGALQEVADRLGSWTEAETGARKEILSGMPLLAALDKYGHL